MVDGEGVMGKFITYFTDQQVPSDSPLFYGAVGFSAVCLLAGLLAPLLLIWAKRQKHKKIVQHATIIRSLAGVARTIGFLELFVLFLRYESIFPFTNRVWMIVIGLIGVMWVFWHIKKYRKILPTFAKQDILEQRYTKYLPKPKKRTS
jgi:hypothetical protein